MAVTNEKLKEYSNDDDFNLLIKAQIQVVIQEIDKLDKNNSILAEKAGEEAVTLLGKIKHHMFTIKYNPDGIKNSLEELNNNYIVNYNKFIQTLEKIPPENKRLQIAISVLCVAFLVTGITLLVISHPPLALIAADFIKMGWAFLAVGVMDTGIAGCAFFSERKGNGLRLELSRGMKNLANSAANQVNELVNENESVGQYSISDEEQPPAASPLVG